MIVDFENTIHVSDSIITFGNFDGVHKGHKLIINELKKISNKENLKSVLVTFNPHTAFITQDGGMNHKIITPYDYKISLLKNESIDFISVVDFNLLFSKITHDLFLDKIIEKYNPRIILIGYDNRFGYKAKGNFNSLSKSSKILSKNIKVVSLDKLRKSDIEIKSSAIKDYISSGNVKFANKALGRKYKLFGKIVKGKSLGNLLGFPTANLEVSNKQQIIPKVGVYYVNFVIGNNRFKSLCNIGYKPTFGNNNKLSIETHILSKEKFVLYNLDVEIEFIDYVREEIKFSSTDFLIEQINKDIKKVNKIN